MCNGMGMRCMRKSSGRPAMRCDLSHTTCCSFCFALTSVTVSYHMMSLFHTTAWYQCPNSKPHNSDRVLLCYALRQSGCHDKWIPWCCSNTLGVQSVQDPVELRSFGCWDSICIDKRSENDPDSPMVRSQCLASYYHRPWCAICPCSSSR